MRSGMLCLSAIACAVLSSCSSVKPELFKQHPVYLDVVRASKVQCSTKDCSLTVTVSDCANGGIQVTDPTNPTNGPDLDMSSGPTNQVRSITWTITTPGYEFTKDPFKYGLLIKSDPGDEFKNSQVTQSGDSVTIQYKKKAIGAPSYYTYGLQLRSTTGNKDYCQLLDPWLIS